MSYLENIGQSPNFNVGDKVVCIDADDNHDLQVNKKYTVTEIEYDIDADVWFVAVEEVDPMYGCEWYASRFEKAN